MGKTSISFITNRTYDASQPELNERFLTDYGDRLWYGTFEVGLGKRTAIGADHWDSYHVFQFSVEEEAQFWTALDAGFASNEKMIIMIHGFKTSMADALLRAAILKMDLGFAGQVIAFSWPADFRVSRYLKDGVNARRSVDDFIEIVNRILSLRSGSNLFVISHSMGAELVVEAVAELVDIIDQDDDVVELIFAAPDVDSVIFEKESR